MALLHRELRDLFINTIAYGNVGTEAALARHLLSRRHLTPAREAVVVATLNDALLAIGDPMRLQALASTEVTPGGYCAPREW